MNHEQTISLRRNTTLTNPNFNNKIITSSSSSLSSYSNNNNNINFSRSTSSNSTIFSPLSPNQQNQNPLSLKRVTRTRFTVSSFLRSFLHVFSFSATSTCRWLTLPSLSLSSPLLALTHRKVSGTLFGHRKGHVSFAVQDNLKAEPAFVIELAISTSALVREMSSGLVRIALECNATARGKHAPRLLQERAWTMYCNGRKCGHAGTRECTEFDRHVLNTVRSVSVGAGVIPLVENRTGSGSEGELLYMRAKFERVVGNRDSEAFYMLNPDGNGGPELSIFLLRV